MIIQHCSYRLNDIEVEDDNNSGADGNEEGIVRRYGENTSAGW